MSYKTYFNESTNKRFKDLQLKFINWAANWIRNEDKKIEGVTFDVADVAAILQAVGYKVTRVDVCSPENICPLRGGEKGTRFTLTCLHSGQKFMMEYPTSEKTCNCSKITSDTKDGFWEITATTPGNKNGTSLVEIGNHLLPPVSREMNQIIRNVLSYLVHMIHGAPSSELMSKELECDPPTAFSTPKTDCSKII